MEFYTGCPNFCTEHYFSLVTETCEDKVSIDFLFSMVLISCCFVRTVPVKYKWETSLEVVYATASTGFRGTKQSSLFTFLPISLLKIHCR